MKKRTIIGSFILLFFLFSACQQGKEPVRIISPKYRKVIKEARKEVIFNFVRNATPGGAVAVSIDGKTVWSEAFGMSSLDLQTPVTRFTKFRIGDISQVLTSLLYYRLVEMNKMEQDKEVRHYLPSFPEKQWPLTMQNLIDQTSGIRQPTPDESGGRALNVSLKNNIESFEKDSLLFPPGMYQFSTHFSFNLAGYAMEETMKESFSKLVRKMVTDTLKMGNTVPDNPLITIEQRSQFYDRNFIAQVIPAISRDLRQNLPSSGYLSTAEDLLKLGNGLLNDAPFSETVRKKMMTAPVLPDGTKLNWGNGMMFLTSGSGQNFVGARGIVYGSGAMLLVFPDNKLVVSLVSNLDDEGDEMPGLKIASMFSDFLSGNFKPAQEMENAAPADTATAR